MAMLRFFSVQKYAIKCHCSGTAWQFTKIITSVSRQQPCVRQKHMAIKRLQTKALHLEIKEIRDVWFGQCDMCAQTGCQSAPYSHTKCRGTNMGTE